MELFFYIGIVVVVLVIVCRFLAQQYEDLEKGPGRVSRGEVFQEICRARIDNLVHKRVGVYYYDSYAYIEISNDVGFRLYYREIEVVQMRRYAFMKGLRISHRSPHVPQDLMLFSRNALRVMSIIKSDGVGG